MKKGRLRTCLVAAGATALAIGATTALAGSGVGAAFNLGQTNTVDATSTLSGASAVQLKVQNNSTASGAFSVLGLISASIPGSNSAALRGQNNGTGAAGYGVWGSQAGSGTGVYGTSPSGIGVYGRHTGSTGNGAGVKGDSAAANTPGLLGVNTAGGPALTLLVNSGRAPFTVNSGVKVTNLNADLLDGFDGSAFWKTTGNAATTSSNFLGTTDSQPLIIKTNGSEAMRLDSVGNVGIGTATPAEKLDVSGTVAADNSSTVLDEGFENATFPPDGNWTTGAQNPWTQTTAYAYEGSGSAHSALFPYSATSGTSYLQLDYTLPAAGRIDFRWMMQNPSNGRALYFCIDNNVGCGSQAAEQLTGGPASGLGWVHHTVNVPAGHHTFTWLLVVTGSGMSDHQAWLDSVKLETVGVAMKAQGHAEQSLSAGGWAKALVRQYGGLLQHCYNSQGASPDTCDGFSISTGSTGLWLITFPFDVDDRFVSVTAESGDSTPCCMTSFSFTASNQIRVRTWTTSGSPIDRAFTIAVF